MGESLELRDYQRNQLVYHLKHKRSLNRSEPGTGKTPVFCSLIKYVYELEGSCSVMINPVSLSVKNREELLRWTGFDEKEVVIVKGTPKKRELIYSDRRTRVLIVGADTFAKEYDKIDSRFKSIVVDESHTSFSTHTSKRTQALYKASARFPRILFCTGTPVSQRYSSVYPMCALFNPRYYGTYNRFCNIHRVVNSLGYTVGWRNPEPISKFLKEYSVGITFEQAYPDKTETMVFVEKCEMEKDHEKIYREMEQEALLELEDKYIEAGNPGVQALRCRQILECPEVINAKVSVLAKDELLKNHLERVTENGYSLLVFSSFIGEQERVKKICDEMGITSEIMNGSCSQERRSEIDKNFRSGTTKVLIGTPSVCGFGYNWEHVSEIVFLSCSYSDSDFDQAIARGNRGTRKSALPVYILRYDCRVEERVWEVIRRKKKENKQVMKGLSL